MRPFGNEQIVLERHAKPDVFRHVRIRWKPFFLCPIPPVRDRATDASAMRPYLWNHQPMRPIPHVRDGQAPTFCGTQPGG